MNETSAMELPKGVIGPLVNSDFGDTVAMLVAIHGRRYGYRELHDYADRIQDELRAVRNVGKLATYGEQSEEIRITSSLERMSQYFADPLRVMQALQQRNIIQSAGSLDTGAGESRPCAPPDCSPPRTRSAACWWTFRAPGSQSISAISPRWSAATRIPTFVVRYDGEPSVLLSIEMQKGKNIVQLGDELGEVFARLPTILPPDIHST